MAARRLALESNMLVLRYWDIKANAVFPRRSQFPDRGGTCLTFCAMGGESEVIRIRNSRLIK